MRRRLFLAGVLLHAVVLLGWTLSLEAARARAVTIRLSTLPVDPRDYLRGDYIWLRYRVSELPRSAFKGPSPDNGDVGRTVYVALEPRGPVHEATAASLRREALALAPGQHLLVGRLSYAAAGRNSGLLSVRYGIERYYVPEGKGTPPQRALEAEVALTADGRAFRTGLYVDGKPYP
jgi:uncharacterized membrane-anchored protein